MKKSSLIIIGINLIFLLTYFNYSVFKKEEILKHGQTIYLKLAPVDPRSLMQGDFMHLRYELSNDIVVDSLSSRGYCVVKMNAEGIAQLVRFQKEKLPLKNEEHLIAYTRPDKFRLNIGAESYFFQEGKADHFAEAAFGGIKIDQHGNSLLIGLYDKKLNKL